ncbi:MAG: serine/threonine protein phosphatase [Deltaproteobacteria bacterium]|jgi:serine/threonine protein phosphatase 1|nr:serine/threonine protein phosphatase [Deltaproteobacteria bacterium]
MIANSQNPRIFVIGDIHGCRLKLEELLLKIDWRPANQEKLVFLGDYIDRGLDSYGVVEKVLELKNRWRERVVLLKGNHEQMFFNYISGKENLSLTSNGSEFTIDSYRQNAPFPISHIDFYQNLELFHETESHIFVHAGLRPGVGLGDQAEDDLLWIRDEFLESAYDFGKTVVFGHTPVREPYFAPGRVGLDTGAVFVGGRLTCWEAVEDRIISV